MKIFLFDLFEKILLRLPFIKIILQTKFYLVSSLINLQVFLVYEN